MNSKRLIRDHAMETMSDAESILLEDRLWWVRGRKSIIRRYMECVKRRGETSTIMDIGCGSGGNLDVLHEYGRVLGVERSEVLANRARMRGVADAVFTRDAVELDGCRHVDLFTMFDVLEHVEFDRDFLSQLRINTYGRHHLLVSVPACQFLYSDHDRILHHYRRYSRKSLQSVLEGAGYQVLQMNYFMFFLFPIVLFARLKSKIMAKLGRKIASVDVGGIPQILSAPFVATLTSEACLSQKIRFPIGLWLFALAESNGAGVPPGTSDAGRSTYDVSLCGKGLPCKSKQGELSE